MTENQILTDLIRWSKQNNALAYTHFVTLISQLGGDRKAAARALLKCRIEKEPNYLYQLSYDLMAKLGYEVQQVSIDTFPKLTGLAKPGSLVTIIRRIV